MHYLLAIDQGTSSTRAMLFTKTGELVKMSQHQLTQFYPHPGWVEHDPEEIWQTTLLAIREVIASIPVNKIIACGITNQRETTLIWDKQTNKCLAPAIVWQDRRTSEYCRSLGKYEAIIQAKTGLLLDPYFSASKLNWLLQNIPNVDSLLAQNRLAFGTIDSFLIYRLTAAASHFTDITNASRTQLFNIHTQQWDDELLNIFAIPKEILPEVCASDANFGNINKELFGSEIPINGVAGDQQAAMIGQGCVANGMVKATFGTGGFLMLNTDINPVESKHKLLTTIAYKIGGKTIYGLEGSLYQAGTTVKWLRDELKIITTSSETKELAESLTSNEGLYFVPSFTGLGAPHWLSIKGALIIGLSRTSNRAHFARAALESVCYQTRDILIAMGDDSNIPISILRVDGGMAANNWMLQFLASLCGIEVARPNFIETTAQGAAMLAAIGNGIMDLEYVSKHWVCDEQFKPLDNMITMDEYYNGWLQALVKAKS